MLTCRKAGSRRGWRSGPRGGNGGCGRGRRGGGGGGGAMAFRSERGERRLAGMAARVRWSASQRVAGRYRLSETASEAATATFGMWLRAGEQGATVEVRDYYPIPEARSHYYRSGL